MNNWLRVLVTVIVWGSAGYLVTFLVLYTALVQAGWIR